MKSFKLEGQPNRPLLFDKMLHPNERPINRFTKLHKTVYMYIYIYIYWSHSNKFSLTIYLCVLHPMHIGNLEHYSFVWTTKNLNKMVSKSFLSNSTTISWFHVCIICMSSALNSQMMWQWGHFKIIPSKFCGYTITSLGIWLWDEDLGSIEFFYLYSRYF